MIELGHEQLGDHCEIRDNEHFAIAVVHTVHL